MKVSDNMKFSKDRSLLINILFFIISLLSIFLLPALLMIYFKSFIKDENILSIVCNIILIVYLYLMYYKDLNEEFKKYKNNFKSSFALGLKYYFVGLLAMIFSNLLISFIIKNISTNESIVRDTLYKNPIFTLISITIIAPLSEEIIFRKSLSPIIKNKWIYAFACGLLFGGAHLLAGPIHLVDLLYLIPYGSLGFVFALMDFETKSTWTSIVMHALHNGVTGIVLLLVYYSGVM